MTLLLCGCGGLKEALLAMDHWGPVGQHPPADPSRRGVNAPDLREHTQSKNKSDSAQAPRSYVLAACCASGTLKPLLAERSYLVLSARPLSDLLDFTFAFIFTLQCCLASGTQLKTASGTIGGSVSCSRTLGRAVCRGSD